VSDSAPPTRRSLVDWFFRDRGTGAITIAQPPNPALWLFLATIVLRWLVPEGGTAQAVVAWIGLAALAWWAVDEVVRGVNPWRRVLGVAGCVLVLVGVMSRLG
jgi:hypothetical protein